MAPGAHRLQIDPGRPTATRPSAVHRQRPLL